MKKILLIQAHPNPASFNFGIAKAYKKGAEAQGAEVKELIISELDFEPNLKYGYQQKMGLEPDLIQAQQQLKWAEHIVVVHPLWWGGVPAKFKGFLDRTFLPGFAFRFKENSIWWDKLLKGRSGRIICTMDQPYFYYRWFNGQPAINQLKKMTMEFSGIKTRVTTFGPVRGSTAERREKWLGKVYKLGEKMK